MLFVYPNELHSNKNISFDTALGLVIYEAGNPALLRLRYFTDRPHSLQLILTDKGVKIILDKKSFGPVRDSRQISDNNLKLYLEQIWPMVIKNMASYLAYKKER